MASRAALFEHPELFSKKVRYDSLFELETWLKGIEAFLQVDNLALSPEERGRTAIRNYVDEISVARDALVYVGRVTQRLLGEGKEDFASFLQYLERQMARNPGEPGRLRSLPPEVEIAEAVEKIEDFVRVLEELSHSRYIAQPPYLSAPPPLTPTLPAHPNLGSS